MTIRWLRIVGAAVMAEIIPIVLLVTPVAIFRPSDVGEARASAARLGSAHSGAILPRFCWQSG